MQAYDQEYKGYRIVANGGEEGGYGILDENIDIVFATPASAMNFIDQLPKFLAVADTAYMIFAIGSTEQEARDKAVDACVEWLRMDPAHEFVTDKYVEQEIRINVYPISDYGVAQEG